MTQQTTARYRVVWILAAFTCISPEVRAGWLGEKLGQLGRAVGDVVSLGQAGRDRDRERAEAERARAAQARAAAEQQRKLQIDALTKDVSLLRDVTKSFESSVDAINGIAALQVAISNAGSMEITARSASFTIVERVRDYFRKDLADLELLLKAVSSAQYVRSEDLKRVFGQTPDPKGLAALEAIRKSQVAAMDAVKNQLTLLKQSGLTEEAFLEQAIKKLKTDNIKQIINLAEDSKLRLRKLGEELDGERKNYRAQLATQVTALATLSATDRAALAAKWEAGLKPTESAAAGGTLQSATASLNKLVLSENLALPQVSALMQYGGAVPAPQKIRVCLSFGLSCFDAVVQ